MMAVPALARAAGGEGPSVFGIPVDFILFALTLLGVALFHGHTLRVALIGLATIVTYKLLVTGFKTGDGIAGFGLHLAHEWVILTNLLGLLLGLHLQHFRRWAWWLLLSRFCLVLQGFHGLFYSAL